MGSPDFEHVTGSVWFVQGTYKSYTFNGQGSPQKKLSVVLKIPHQRNAYVLCGHSSFVLATSKEIWSPSEWFLAPSVVFRPPIFRENPDGVFEVRCSRLQCGGWEVGSRRKRLHWDCSMIQ